MCSVYKCVCNQLFYLFRSTVVTLKMTPLSQRIIKSLWENGQLPMLSPSLPAYKHTNTPSSSSLEYDSPVCESSGGSIGQSQNHSLCCSGSHMAHCNKVTISCCKNQTRTTPSMHWDEVRTITAAEAALTNLLNTSCSAPNSQRRRFHYGWLLIIRWMGLITANRASSIQQLSDQFWSPDSSSNNGGSQHQPPLLRINKTRIIVSFYP